MDGWMDGPDAADGATGIDEPGVEIIQCNNNNDSGNAFKLESMMMLMVVLPHSVRYRIKTVHPECQST